MFTASEMNRFKSTYIKYQIKKIEHKETKKDVKKEEPKVIEENIEDKK